MTRSRAVKSASVASAASAGLRYVTDRLPGIRREMGPGGFTYIGTDGKRIRSASELARIRALAIPPAWSDVWICAYPRGHLQATGRDAKGRKQYRYHADWRIGRDESKFDRMQAFAARLPGIRRRTRADLGLLGLPRDKVLAAIVQLLEKSLIRVGNEEYVKQNRSFGLTTLRNRHVRVRGGVLRFQFRGKSRIHHSVDVDDRRLARVVKQCRDLPGHELFQYLDDAGAPRRVDSSDINRYLKDVTGEDFTAKDFRTWSGTVHAVSALRELSPASTKTESARNVALAMDAVSKLLGNTRAVCRKSYVHPGIIDCYHGGAMARLLDRHLKMARRNSAGLRVDEVAAIALLTHLHGREPGKRNAA